MSLSKRDQKTLREYFDKLYGEEYRMALEVEPKKVKAPPPPSFVTLDQALETINELARLAAGRCNRSYVQCKIDETRGIMRLFTGREPPMDLENLCDVCDFMGVEYETYTKNGEPHIVWGKELEKRRGKRKRVRNEERRNQRRTD